MFNMGIIAIAIFSLIFFLAARDESHKKEREMNFLRDEINNLKNRR